MLSRKNRFHGHGSVRRTYRQGRPIRSNLFSMHVLSGDKVKNTRVAVVVSRKVHKSAVKRNRIRRRIYELIRLRLPSVKTPTEIVVTVYKDDIASLPSAELQKEVDYIFKKANL